MMLAIAVLLVVALLPTGSPVWLRFPGEPVACYYQSLITSWHAPGPNLPGNAQFLAMSTVGILAIAYLTRFIKLFKWSSVHARILLRVKPGRLVKRCLDAFLGAIEFLGPKWTRWAIPLFYKPCIVGFVIATAVFDLIESMLWEVCGATSPKRSLRF
jgi:hypothetical protein